MGIGIIFAPHNSGLAICGIDIDAHHVNSNPLSAEILAMFSDTYIEQSPSGKGYHILFLAELNRIPKSYKQTYKQKNSELDVECYISGMTNRYFTFTGNQKSKSNSLIDKTDTLLEFLDKYMRFSSSPVSSDIQIKLTGEREYPTAIDVPQRLEIALNARNGNLFSALYSGDTNAYNSPSEAVQALVDMLVFYFGDGGENLVEAYKLLASTEGIFAEPASAASVAGLIQAKEQNLVKDVYMHSGMAKGKWGERDEIINSTISNAFQRVSERYTPPQSRQKNEKSNNKLTEKEGGSSSDNKKKQMIDYEMFSEYLKNQGYSIRYNQITHNFEFFGFDKGESVEHLAENVPTILRDKLKKIYSHVSRQDITDYITQYATRNKYNPILDKIKSTQWDGKDRIEEIYTIFKIPPESTEEGKYSRIYIKKWLMQACCGLFNVIKCPFSLDIILIFKGRQGIGKTRFFEKLALESQFFGEGICLDPRDKDSVMQATSKWISELGEIGSTMRKDMDSVKAFLTKSTDDSQQSLYR